MLSIEAKETADALLRNASVMLEELAGRNESDKQEGYEFLAKTFRALSIMEEARCSLRRFEEAAMAVGPYPVFRD